MNVLKMLKDSTVSSDVERFKKILQFEKLFNLFFQNKFLNCIFQLSVIFVYVFVAAYYIFYLKQTVLAIDSLKLFLTILGCLVLLTFLILNKLMLWQKRQELDQIVSSITAIDNLLKKSTKKITQNIFT